MLYRGHELVWTGWKASQQNLHLAGQWYTFLTKDWILCTSCPGITVQILHPWDVVDLCVQDHQDCVFPNSPPYERVGIELKMKDLLIAGVDAYHERLEAGDTVREAIRKISSIGEVTAALSQSNSISFSA